ncbi:MAG: bifunctional tetrahydrofolate synthase/dihydrofolate synthase [Gammaproteobacteria bacterium]|nr:bifunctional tetrahydrofolate synthase/dihydrofolate synthase [Gammaproteobacteria bacterium]
MNTLNEWLRYCENLAPGIDLGLDRVNSVAQSMALSFTCPIVTVAGTNGKGSSCALLEAIFLACGYRCAVYTSPHIWHFTERGRMNGSIIGEDYLIPHFQKVFNHQTHYKLTFFEFTTLVYLSLFADLKPDVMVLEVGLGGRLDAVNIVDPTVALITTIDIDHTEYLGPTREHIGQEKAGIMRPHAPVVISDLQAPESVLAYAQEIHAITWRPGIDYHFHDDRIQWSWKGKHKFYPSLPLPNLRGRMQLNNASAVLAVIEALAPYLAVPLQAIRQGLTQVTLPGRFQILPGQPSIVLDVAHNPQAAENLRKNLDDMGFYAQNWGVYGSMADKDIAGFLTAMNPLIDTWYFCDLPIERAARAQKIAEIYLSLAQILRLKPYKLCLNPQEGLDLALQSANPSDRIIITGSFLTVAGITRT